MASGFSTDRIRFLANRFRERLWVKPLAICLVSIGAVFVASLADDTGLGALVPEIASDSIASLLSIMASSMLVIATFAAGAMVSAYASASRTATPRSFPLILADDVSQNALSTFIGAFIFSVVAFTTVKNDYYGAAGLFVLFVFMVIVFSLVVITFVRWVDRIARLGRMGSTVAKVEKATAEALVQRRDAPTLYGAPLSSRSGGQALYAASIGYVQHIDMAALQAWADDAGARIVIAALPGTFATPERPLAYLHLEKGIEGGTNGEAVIESFQIGKDRMFDDDPRFGLVVLSEIASRALSPAVNDPGTAIDILGTLVRLFSRWSEEPAAKDQNAPNHDRVEVPALSIRDMFDDAFLAIGRDGAGMVEVSVRLQKTLNALSATGNDAMREAARYHGKLALKRARIAMDTEEDLAVVEEVAGFTER